MTITVLVNRFLNHCREERKSISTLSSYATDLKQFSASLRATDLNSLFHRDIRDAIARLVHELTPNSQARKLSTVKSFLLWCYRKGFMEENLGVHIMVPKRRSLRRVHPLSSSQIARLRREAAPTERLLLELILQTGMRLRDVVSLRSKHLSNNTITIPSSGLTLPLAEPLLKALSRSRLMRPIGERSTVLFNAQGRPISVRTATTILRNLARRAGVRGATARNLRTTFIVRQLEAHVPFPTIQNITGFQTLGSLSMYRRLAVQQTKQSSIAIAEI
jgi:site-specific recombinase XerD